MDAYNFNGYPTQKLVELLRDGAFIGSPGRIMYVGEEPGRNITPSQGTGEASGSWFRIGDTMRSLVPLHGDYRLVAGQRDVPSTVFAPHQYYNDVTKYLAHSMTEVLGSSYIFGGTMEGKFFEGSTKYASDRRPDVPFKSLLGEVIRETGIQELVRLRMVLT